MYDKIKKYLIDMPMGRQQIKKKEMLAMLKEVYQKEDFLGVYGFDITFTEDYTAIWKH